jgi:hypothetical protein
MECFGPRLELRDAEPRDRWLELVQERDLLVERESPKQVVDPFLERQLRVLELEGVLTSR